MMKLSCTEILKEPRLVQIRPRKERSLKDTLLIWSRESSNPLKEKKRLRSYRVIEAKSKANNSKPSLKISFWTKKPSYLMVSVWTNTLNLLRKNQLPPKLVSSTALWKLFAEKSVPSTMLNLLNYINSFLLKKLLKLSRMKPVNSSWNASFKKFKS